MCKSRDSGERLEGAICITAYKRTEFAQLAERNCQSGMRLEDATAKGILRIPTLFWNKKPTN